MLAESVDLEDVWMADPRHRACLRREPVSKFDRLEPRMDELDGDPPVEAHVLGEEDDPHRAAPEWTNDAVDVADHRPGSDMQETVGVGPGWARREGPMI